MPKRHRVLPGSHGLAARVEEVLIASGAGDAFETAFAVIAARGCTKSPATTFEAPWPLAIALKNTARAWPWAQLSLDVKAPPLEALSLMDKLAAREDGLDALFETLSTRARKGDKGQFFTPRHAVELAVRALRPRAGERWIDPACGSGAFLSHAARHAKIAAYGVDVDARAIRVAMLSATLANRTADFRVGDGLRNAAKIGHFDVVATNPPFAGEADTEGFELASTAKRVERDALFLERAVTLLRPKGRLAIVLPSNKVASARFTSLRTWLDARARVFAVISLPRETFLPHTGQRAAIVIAKKRAPKEAPRADERILFAVSERAGKDTAGLPVMRRDSKPPPSSKKTDAWHLTDHDLDALLPELSEFLAAEGFYR